MLEIEETRRQQHEDNSGRNLKKSKIDIENENEGSTSKSIPKTILIGSSSCTVPSRGMCVDKKEFRMAGSYIIGPEVVGHRPVRCIVQYLARKQNTNKFYQLKILQLSMKKNYENNDERQGKMLLHTEHSLLSLLKNEEGVVQHHSLFSDLAFEEISWKNGEAEYTGIIKRRIILVLDCLIQHPYCDKSASYISLQEYLICPKKLSESEAIFIFYEIIKIVENIHKKNVIHRDLKLGNIVLNKNSKKVIITNFCLGKYLFNEDTWLHDQKGSPAYISPDVVCGKPYKGKPSDMWALGVVFFIMLYGSFPFYKSTSSALFAQIQSGEYEIPTTSDISKNSIEVIKGLLKIDSETRLKATELRQKLESMLAFNIITSPDQCVPTKINYNKFYKNFKITRTELTDDQIVPNFNKNDENKKSKLLKNNNENDMILLSNRNEFVQKFLNPINGNINGRKPIEEYMRTTQAGPLLSATEIYPLIRNYLGFQRNTLISQNLNRSLDNPRINITNTSDNMVRNFISLLDHHFISGQIIAPRNRPLLEFNGILTFDIATCIQNWLLEKFNHDPLVQQIFSHTEASNTINRIKTLLIRCGVNMDVTIFGPKICRNQTVHVLLILTYMLKISGYNNTYFITQLSVAR